MNLELVADLRPLPKKNKAPATLEVCFGNGGFDDRTRQKGCRNARSQHGHSNLGKARAEYLAAQARAELAKQTLERKRSLAAERIVPQREVQEAKAASSSADAELRNEPLIKELLGATAGSSSSVPDGDTPFYAVDLRGVGESRPDTCGSDQFLSPYGSDYFYAARSFRVRRLARVPTRQLMEPRVLELPA